jgi:hypothetical protein
MTPEDLIQAKEEAFSVPYQSFVLMTGSFPNDLFCFIEGKDAPYYHFRIKSEYGGEIHYVNCKGKKNVLKVKQMIEQHKEYDALKTNYFIDKDFDISLNKSSANLYETPCYSIENLYCTPSSVKEILKCEFQLLESDKEFENIYNIYVNLLDDYSKAILLFNAWYSLQKEKSRTLRIPNNVSLDSSLPKGYIKVSIEKIDSDYDLEKIKATFQNSIEVNREELVARMTELSKGDIHQNLRGKYMFNFLVHFIRDLITDANTKGKQKYLSKKAKFNIDNNTALSSLSSYAETPDCLREFARKAK